VQTEVTHVKHSLLDHPRDEIESFTFVDARWDKSAAVVARESCPCVNVRGQEACVIVASVSEMIHVLSDSIQERSPVSFDHHRSQLLVASLDACFTRVSMCRQW